MSRAGHLATRVGIATRVGLAVRVVAVGVALAAATATAADRPPAFPVSPAEAEARLARQPFEVEKAKRTASGVAGAQRLDLRFGDDTELRAKWKAAPRSGEGWNNTPRKEVAAYEIQKLFLEPGEYVVPTTAARCIPIHVHQDINPKAGPTLADTTCVYGALSLWLVDVSSMDKVVDRERARKEPVYGRTLADVNLLSYLIGHKDGRLSNYLEGEDGWVYSVDNGVAFDPKLYNWFQIYAHLNKVRVPLRPESVERLRRLGPEQLDALAVLAEYRMDEGGVLVAVEPGENLDPDKGTRMGRGHIQIGLTRKEIANLRELIRKLLERVDAGEVELR